MKTENSNLILVGLYVIVVLVVILLIETLVSPLQIRSQTDSVVNINETSK